VIDVARSFVDKKSLAATEYLRRIKRESEEAEDLRRALEEERRAVEEKYSSLDRAAERRERERQVSFAQELERVTKEFELHARDLLNRIEDRAMRVRVEREADKRSAELRREAEARRAEARAATAWQTTTSGARIRRAERADSAERDDAKSGDESVSSTPSRPIAVGDHVRLRTLGSEGIVERISGSDAEVRVKNLRFREKVKNLELVAPRPEEKDDSLAARLREMQARGTEVRLSRETRGEPHEELNLIGKTTDEAADEVDKFLDEAYLQGLNGVRIIHGHGTGALRRAVAEILKSHPHVASFAPAPDRQGGAGATVVELRQ
jgi:DNA mismatch repair protein MutS2